jgi:hypothetical protein
MHAGGVRKNAPFAQRGMNFCTTNSSICNFFFARAMRTTREKGFPACSREIPYHDCSLCLSPFQFPSVLSAHTIHVVVS